MRTRLLALIALLAHFFSARWQSLGQRGRYLLRLGRTLPSEHDNDLIAICAAPNSMGFAAPKVESEEPGTVPNLPLRAATTPERGKMAKLIN
jgi:hypothetical protein